MNTLELDAKNIKCAGCAGNIRTGLMNCPGVREVEVEISSGHVSITGEELSETAIRQKLESLGYPAT